jgi:hypothetical protein
LAIPLFPLALRRILGHGPCEGPSAFAPARLGFVRGRRRAHDNFRLRYSTVETLREGKRILMRQNDRLSREEAESMAIDGLQYLASEPESLGRFLAVTGIGPGDLRAAAQDSGFLGGVLEFFMENEALLVDFADKAGVRPTMVAAAHFALVGHHQD